MIGEASSSDRGPGEAPAAAPRARAITELALGAVLLSAVAAVLWAGAGVGSWTGGRILSLAVPGLAAAFLVAAGIMRLRRGAGPHDRSDSRWARVARAIEPYEVWIVFALAVAVLLPGAGTYPLIDPWETHYSEVARRMLQDNDWVHTVFWNEGFESKPVLSFWLIATSLDAFGIAQNGGYSGELLASGWVRLAARLPFVLFGAMGIAMTWWMLARLATRRLAWIAAAVLATTTLYFMVARQAMTDMPMVASAMGAVACLAMTIERGSAPLEPIAASGGRWLGRVDAYHLFMALFTVAIGGEALYYAAYFTRAPLARGLHVPVPAAIVALPMLLGLAALWLWNHKLSKIERRGQVWMFWFYALVGVSVLAKGPPGLGVVGLVSLLYLVVTGRWGLLRAFEIPRGVLITVLVALPWHVAMWMRDGNIFITKYVSYNILARFTEREEGSTPATFVFYAHSLAVGLWPWSGLVPAALAACLLGAKVESREGRLRLMAVLWAIGAMVLFGLSATKWQYYILPAVPALSLMVAFFLDDLWRGRVARLLPAVAVAVAVTAVLAVQLVGGPDQLIDLYVFRTERPWPSGDPWNVDVSGWFFAFGVAFAVGFALLLWRRVRRPAIGLLFAGGLAWLAWAGTGYMQAAGPHWGMQNEIATYYHQRHIHGVDIQYYGLHELWQDWKDGPTYRVESLLPGGFATGAPMRVELHIPDAGLPDNQIVLRGHAEDLGDHAFTIRLEDGELSKIAELVKRGKGARRRGPAWHQVNADRLLAWQLYWRGENFWSADEIWGRLPDTRTVFKDNNQAFLEYLEKPGQVGRTFYLITEASRARGLEGTLPTKRAKDTFELVDTSCNKFTLVRFTL